MASSFKAELSPESLRLLRRMASEAGPALRKQVQRELKEAASDGAHATQNRIRGAYLAAGEGSSAVGRRRKGVTVQRRGLREAIARGVSVSVTNSGVRIVSRDPGGARRGMNQALEKPVFRHPIFGRRGRRVAQKGAGDWFNQPIREREPQLRNAVLTAMQKAADELEGTK